MSFTVQWLKQTAAKLRLPVNLSPLPQGQNAQKFTSTHPVRLLGVLVRHGGKFTFYLVELRAASYWTDCQKKRAISLSLSFSPSLSFSLSREGAGDLGSIRARLSSITTPPCCQAGINMHGVQNGSKLTLLRSKRTSPRLKPALTAPLGCHRVKS